MRRTLLILSCFILGNGAGYCIGRNFGLKPMSTYPVASAHTGLTIQQIQPLSALMTTRVDVADVQETTVSGYTGSVKVAILVKGDFLLGVDLAEARFDKIDPDAKTAILILPEPTLSSPRVDHTRTRIFAISSSGLWQLVPGSDSKPQLLNHAFDDAQRIVASASTDPALIARAKSHARCVLVTFFEAMGWAVEVR